MNKKITYVLPVYNEEKIIQPLYDRFLPVIQNLESRNYEVELILVNDGSKDRSIEEMLEIQKKDKRFTILNLSRNFGHQIAITAGLDYANGDAVVIIDADLQDPPEVSLDLIAQWEKGFEVIYAQRRSRQDGFLKKLTANFFYVILEKLADLRIPKNTGDFRLMDRKVVLEVNKMRERSRFMRGLTVYTGFKQTAVLFDRHERTIGKTHYPFHKMLKLAIDGITGFSTIPLQLITQFGIFVSFFSFIGILYVILQRIFFPEIVVIGWSAIVFSILFIGGVQIIMIGILGSYIGRIYIEVQNRPLYIVDSVLKSPFSS